MRKDKGITLISLVVTIVIIIILAGIVISLSLGENGIFTRAKETKKLQIIAEVKEQIGTQILSAQVEAFARNEELEQSQVEDIISKYGWLQEDKDTIILKDNGYEISLLEIYNGTTAETGSYTENKAKIELLEKQVATLQEKLENSSTNYKNFDITQKDYAFSYTIPYDGKVYISSVFNCGGTTSNPLYSTFTLYYNSTELFSKGHNTSSSFSYNYQDAIDVKKGDIIKAVTTNTPFTASNTSICLFYN